MNERLHALLDDAVSDLEPADPDPVPAIIARGRAARRRTVLAGALATVLLAGLAVAGARVIDRPVPVAPAAPQPPTPRVVGGTVVAGDVNVPIPRGWRVVVGSPKAPCGDLKDTVLIHGPGVRYCQSAPIEVGGTSDGFAPGTGIGAVADGGLAAAATRMVGKHASSSLDGRRLPYGDRAPHDAAAPHSAMRW